MQKLASEPIPVTVLAGFLGSGKTTLLNHILKNNNGLRIALIVNEFGEVGIDNELIIGADEEIVELNNGCLCCSVRGDLIKGIKKLIKGKKQFDYLVIETTGLANPGPVAQTFFMPEMEKVTRLDSIITVVDGENFRRNLENSQTAAEQIGFADIILLNKMDLVSEEQAKAIEADILKLNPYARILHSQHSQVDLRLLLDVGAFSLDRKLEEDPDFLDGLDTHAHDHDHDDHAHGHGHDHGCHDEHCTNPDHHHHEHHGHNHEHGHDHGEDCHDEHCTNPSHDHSHKGHQHHDEDVHSVSFVFHDPIVPEKFEAFLEKISEKLFLFRCKGILNFQGSKKRVIFHGVGNRFTANYDRPWGKEEPVSKIVFIGKELDRQAIKADLDQCLATH